MKTLFVAATGLGLFFSGFFDWGTQPTVSSLRAFEEPLVSISQASADEDAALVAALQAYQKRTSYDDVSALTTFLAAYPQSPWKFSLLANLGIVYRKSGHFSRALEAWEQAWALGKGEKDIKVQALANRVAAELASLLSSLGRTDELASLQSEVKGRTVYGSANAMLMTTNENLWLMKNKPGDSFKCGPYALDSILTLSDSKKAHPKLIREAQSSTKGFSLTQVRDLSNSLKMNYQMAKKQPGADFIVPSVANWKSGHYAAILKKQGDLYLTKDPTFGQEILVTAQALEDESSGYYLVPPGPLPSGWQSVSDAEGNAVWGRGVVANRQPTATKPNDSKTCHTNSKGMAVYSILLMLVSLNIEDTPVGYTPPIGPDVEFTITYNQLEADQPANFSFFNFGPSWNCSWLSYVNTPTTTGATVLVNTRGGGQETYSNTSYVSTGSTYPGYVGYYGNELQSQATLWVTTSGTYERRLPDGSKEVFGLIDSAGFIFLTAITDPQGNSVTLGYDSTFRLTTVTDALGLQTTLTYGLTAHGLGEPADPLKVTQITDPYGRSATFNYTYGTPYQLVSITDEIGITSQFAYGTGSVITQLTTPYGSTTFSASTGDDTIPVRFLNVTEPDGSQVHAESHIDGSNYPYSSEPVPSGHGFSNTSGDSFLLYRNTYYWDKKAMQVTANNPDSDYTKAYIYHWLHTSDGTATSPVLESEKAALENRIWYNYPGQPDPNHVGTSANPTFVARVLDDSTSQVTQYQYNNTANPSAVTAVIDPIGRQTNYTYASNGIDLTQITQTNGTGMDVLKTIAYTGPVHCPTVITDAWGNPSASGNTQSTVITYNSQGQVTSVTPPVRSGHSAETTTYGYTSNYLTSMTGPISGAVTTLTYDTLSGHTVNRVKTRADAEGYTLTYAYDDLDRVTSINYPDTTTEQFVYHNLDLRNSFDRLNRLTHRAYDSTRHLTLITDPLGRTTSYTWCSCGSMTSMKDARNNVTTFNRDLESRLTSKVYQDGTQMGYTYENTTSRLKTITDARHDVTTYAYNLDDTLSGAGYALGSGSTAVLPPTLAYTYDPVYNRISTMVVGGTATTTYNYNAITSTPALGAGLLGSVVNPIATGTATINYSYDEWSREVARNIDGSGNNNVAMTFDALGRVTGVNITPLGNFTYGYFDPTHPTNRLGSVSYPNGQSTSYNYFGSYGSFTSTGDENLKEIKNLTPSSAVLSQHDYTYDAVGKILTWQQQTDANTPLKWTEGYDAADQLTSAVQTNTSTSAVLNNDGYHYDSAGNDTQMTLGATTFAVTFFNNVNQLTSLTSSTAFTGGVNKPGTFTINGSAVTLDGSNNFSTNLSLPAGTNTVTLVAQDAAGNKRTNKYQVNVPPPSSSSLTYDLDGNTLTDEKGNSYQWDVLSRLTKITYPSGATTGFAYDGLNRRVQILEKNSGGTVTATRNFVWDGTDMAEERDASNAVQKRFYAQGEQISGTNYYFAFDHLGSIREMTNSAGIIVSRLDFDPTGRVTVVLGTTLPDFGYAEMYWHQPSGLNLTRGGDGISTGRPYDPYIARFPSRDPMGEAGGINLYGYVRNDPINIYDPLGLVDQNYLPNDTQSQGGYYESPDTFSVIGHGGPVYILDARGKKDYDDAKASGAPAISYIELASYIKNDLSKKFKQGMTVVLISCSTGKDDDSTGEKNNSLAQRLANRLNTPVLAPTVNVDYLTHPINPFKDPSYKLFLPQK